MNYEIFRLQARDFKKCGNIWDMRKHRKRWRKWRREVRSGNRATYIYAERGEYLGEGSLVFENDDPDCTVPGQRIYLSRMIVKQEAQNRGIGGILLAYLCEEAKRMGYREMSLGVNLVNARARHLYEKHGFAEIWRGEDQYGKFIKMLKILEQMS
ncbi:MAG: GNAT family N-acetyltransferase [Oscillospiraceae bacterium]|nr:GNAT family N-acetyltransferase [Oscillospiraceae bacterium]